MPPEIDVEVAEARISRFAVPEYQELSDETIRSEFRDRKSRELPPTGFARSL